MKNSVVMRASFLFLPNPNSPSPGMITTDGLESRSFGESGCRPFLVIFLVCRAVTRNLASEFAPSEHSMSSFGGIPVDKQGHTRVRGSGPGSWCRVQLSSLRPFRTGESERILVICIVGNDSPIRRHASAQRGKISAAMSFAILHWRVLQSTKQSSLFRLMSLNELAHLIDGANAIQVTLALRHAPGEQAMAAKDQPLRPGIFLHRLFDHQRQFKPGALPGNPDDSSPKFSVELFELALAVRAGGKRDGPVRMQMIHVGKRQECV